MTVIAWDGYTLAADKRSCMGTLIRTTTKIFRIETNTYFGSIAGYSGESDAGEELLAWVRDGADPQRFPQSRREGGSGANVLLVLNDRSLLHFWNTPYPVRMPPQHFAIGSGRDFALAAMHLGKTAVEAVEVACHFDSGCGNGIDTLPLNLASMPVGGHWSGSGG
jgi:hypothetical protein